LDNTGSRRFLIVEFDSGTLDDQAALLSHLGSAAPLIAAVFSGSKSLHGWFYVEGQNEKDMETFFYSAVSLGADKALWTKSQFVRMPDGKRTNARRQSIFYLNADLMEGGQ
jgi:hypothetical protein